MVNQYRALRELNSTDTLWASPELRDSYRSKTLKQVILLNFWQEESR